MTSNYDDVPGYVAAMRATFDPTRAAGKTATLQYVFSGRAQGVCHAAVREGALSAEVGPHPAPDVIVTADFDLWRQVLAREVDGLIAWQEGRFTVEGAFETLMESDLWFTR